MLNINPNTKQYHKLAGKKHQGKVNPIIKAWYEKTGLDHRQYIDEKMDGKIKVSKANAKIKAIAEFLNCPMSHVISVNMVSGYTCAMGSACKGLYNPLTGITIWSDVLEFPCYDVKAQQMYKAVAPLQWHNFNTLKNLDAEQMASVILASLPKRLRVVRIHSAGDFFSKEYYKAWRIVANARPEVIFFGYTKHAAYVGSEENFHMIFSLGSKQDAIAIANGLPVCRVVASKEQAEQMGLTLQCEENDFDDFVKIINGESVTLKVH